MTLLNAFLMPNYDLETVKVDDHHQPTGIEIFILNVRQRIVKRLLLNPYALTTLINIENCHPKLHSSKEYEY